MIGSYFYDVISGRYQGESEMVCLRASSPVYLFDFGDWRLIEALTSVSPAMEAF